MALSSTTLFKPQKSTVNCHEPPAFVMGHIGQMYRKFVGTSTPASNMSLIKVVILFAHKLSNTVSNYQSVWTQAILKLLQLILANVLK